MYGLSILCEISKVAFEIRHKIFYPYIEKWPFYTMLKIQKNSYLIARRRFWNARQVVERDDRAPPGVM